MERADRPLGHRLDTSLGVTDQTLVYASYAHGYKAGGATRRTPLLELWRKHRVRNPAATFEPEFATAFELGPTPCSAARCDEPRAFYYDYEGYQTSEIRTAPQ